MCATIPSGNQWSPAQSFFAFIRSKGEIEYAKYATSPLWNEMLRYCEQENTADLAMLFSSHKPLLDNGLSKAKHLLLEWAVRKYSLTVVKCLVDNWCSDVIADIARVSKLLIATLVTSIDAPAKLAFLLHATDIGCSSPNRTNQALKELMIAGIESCEASKDWLDVLLDNISLVDVDSPLNHAIVHNNMLAALSFLEKGVAVNDLFITNNLHSYCTHYASLLSCVVRQARLDWLTLLLSAITQFGSNNMKLIVNAKQEHKNTCLHIAVNCGRKNGLACKKNDYNSNGKEMSDQWRDIIRLLLEHSADVLAVNADDELPLHIAARVGNWEAVHDLLNQGQQEEQLAAKDKAGLTPLLTTAANDSVSCFYTMMCCSALNSQPHHFIATDHKQRTILHLAVASVHCRTNIDYSAVEAIEQFYQTLHTADARCLDRVDCDNCTALDVACERGDDSIVNMILKHSDPDDATRSSAFIKAAKRGKLGTCKSIVSITKGACNSQCDVYGNRGLHWAASRGHVTLVTYLASLPLPPSNHFHQTPMHLAASKGHLGVVKFLAHNKAHMDTSKQGDCLELTPLHYAAIKGRVDIVEYLLAESNSDVTQRDIWNRTVLDVAIESDQFDVCSTILKCSNKVQRRILMNIDVDHSTNSLPVALSTNQQDLLQILQIAEPATEILREQPIKRMIKCMPQLAVLVFELNTRDKQEHVVYNAECIDGCQQYSGRNSHPLCVMIEYKREQLLFHPLVSALLHHKSKPALLLYASFIAMYVLLVSLVTAFIVYSDRPQGAMVCSAASGTAIPPEQLAMEARVKKGLMISSILLIACGLGIEVLQMVAISVRKYVREASNWLDWFSYGSMLLVVIPLTPCGALTRWQMWLSAFSLLASWINITVLLRRVPSCSVYIIIVHHVMKTFLRFLLILSVFILALGLACFVLLPTQNSVPARFDSVLKIVIMKKDTGERDFRDVFHTYVNGGDVGDKIVGAAVYVIYAIFMGVLIIVILDLLVGLAVGDLHKLSSRAKVERIKLAVYLQLDFERSVLWLASRVNCLQGLVCTHKHLVIPKHKPRGCWASIKLKLRSLLLYDFHQPEGLHLDDASFTVKNCDKSQVHQLKLEQSIQFNRFERLLTDVVKPMQQINSEMIGKANETSKMIDDLSSKLELLRLDVTRRNSEIHMLWQQMHARNNS